jgi:predicted dehydrogenase
VTNRTKSRAEEFARRHGNPQVHDTVESLLADANIDAVYIATHPDTHAEFTVQAAHAGKHVLCEKPMAMSVAESNRMLEACRAHHVSLSIAFYRREFPVVKRLKELLDAKAIGRPLSVCIDNYTPFFGSIYRGPEAEC